MKIVVMGPGGVGGYFGARLAAAGEDVTFVARGAHLAAIQKNGLRIDSAERGHVTIKPAKAVADPREAGSADVILFAVKMTDTKAAAEAIKPLVDKGAFVITFQNGVQSVDDLTPIVGRAAIVPGVAYIGSVIGEPGVIRHTGKMAKIAFGEADGAESPRVKAFAAACQKAGFDFDASRDIKRLLWKKFAMLAPMSGMTALTRSPIGIPRSNPESRKLLLAAVAEVVAVGVKLGALKGEDEADAVKTIDALLPGMMSSLAHDLAAGKPLEIFGLSGGVVRLGQACGVPTPTHEFIMRALAPFAAGRPKA